MAVLIAGSVYCLSSVLYCIVLYCIVLVGPVSIYLLYICIRFYSSFIVADRVEVHTKAEGHGGVQWVSDGDGSFVVSDAANLDFERGTRITVKLKADAREFS